jgi:hypothetical protein
MKKWAAALALTTAAVYLVLSVSAAACLSTHESTSRTAHHHSGGATHSSLCAWACQANQTIDLPATAPQSQPLILVALLLLLIAVWPFQPFQQSAQSRAPPRR